MKAKIKLVAPFVVLILVTVFLFWQFFLRSFFLIPGDFLLAWYQPWKSDHILNGTISISHKPIGDDVIRQLFPYKSFIGDSFKSHELPLWNPYNGAGMPFLATMHVGILTPFNVVFILFPDFLGWNVYVMLQLFLLSLFTYLYARKIGLPTTASLFTAFSFTFSGFVIARLILAEYLYVIGTLPLFLYLIESFRQNPYSKKTLLIPFVGALMIFSGHPHMIFYVLITTIVYILWRINSKRGILFLFSLIGIGVGIAMIQIIPTIELFLHGNLNQASSSFIFSKSLLPIQHLITLFVPNYFGNQATYNYWGSGDYIETIVSIGMIPCFFAYLTIPNAFSILKKRSIETFFFFAIILSIILSLDSILTHFVFKIPIPIFSTGVPSRIFLITTFSISILAGCGFKKLLDQENFKPLLYKGVFFFLAMFMLTVATVLFYALGISCENSSVPQCRLVAVRNSFLEFSLFSVCFFLCFFYNARGKNFLIKSIPFIILVVIFLTGIYNSTKTLPFSSRETILPLTPLLIELQEKSEARVFGFDEANIKTDFATYFKFYDPNYYEPLYNKRYGELVSYANTGSFKNLLRSDVEIVKEASVSADLEKRRNRLFNILNVKYFIFSKKHTPSSANIEIWKDKNWYLTKNESTLPRAYLVRSYEIINQQEEILQRLFDSSFNESQTVILEKRPNNTITPQKSMDAKNPNIVTFIKYKPNEVVVSTKNDENSLLVLSDNYYPGWKAYVNGKDEEILRANYTFRAIAVPKGENTVKFIYEPDSLNLGIAITIIFICIYCTIFIFSKKILRNINKTKNS